ncbi:PREDICTED: putative invertase inhibitor [Tarenaya hassleriana]|uniref:putative invertase inhibitor n=1 Tax=Tarenaya hassleriana TaxID=28532 RepID=UPI00053C998B|nr:PREDICTED: putative invertase inhibitor [Tarenaya hassleriana]
MNLPLHLISMVLLFILVSPAHTSDDMIVKTCEKCAAKTEIFNSTFCVSSLEASPIGQPTNLTAMAVVPMLEALDNATATASTIERMMAGGGFDGYGVACLRDCLQLYQDAADELADAVRAFLKGQFGTADVMVSAAMDAAVTCEQGFAERDGGGDHDDDDVWRSPLGRENYSLFELGEISLCIISMLSDGVSTAS